MENVGRSFRGGVSHRIISLVLGGLFILVGLGVVARPAQADPHALFYTVVGQQQLFYNVLAALDQADYVEPKDARDELLEQRAAARTTQDGQEVGFQAETDPIAQATETDLANLLVRTVTLEGQDLWTAYLLHQFALEAARRNATDEIARVYCERGLGRPGCEEEGDPAKVAAAKEEVFVTDSVERSQQITEAGANILASGTSEDLKIRRELLKKDSTAPKKPLPFDPSVAQLNKRIEGSDDASRAARSGLASVSAAVTSIGRDSVDPSVYEPLAEDASFEVMLGKLVSAANLPNSLLTASIRGQAEVRVQQDAIEEGGSLASVEYTSSATGRNRATDDSYTEPVTNAEAAGSIRAQITTPVEATRATVQALADTIADSDTNQKFAAIEGANIPGQQELVDRQQAGGPGNQQNPGNVAGVSTSTTPTPAASGGEGQVAGLLDILSAGLSQLYSFLYDSPKEPLPPNSNVTAPHNESGTSAALQALTNNNFQNGQEADADCGLCIDQQQALPNLGKQVCNFLLGLCGG